MCRELPIALDRDPRTELVNGGFCTARAGAKLTVHLSWHPRNQTHAACNTPVNAVRWGLRYERDRELESAHEGECEETEAGRTVRHSTLPL